jgi:anti-sigma regulatory factor (Ser/Thr protein kinase)
MPDRAATFALPVVTGPRDLGAAASSLEAFLRASGMPARLIGRAAVLLEEAAMNALRHGGATEVRVAVALSAEGCGMTFEDDGVAFDPTTATLPTPARSLEDAPDGGRGLLLMHRFASRMAYRRDGAMNRLEAAVAAT